MDLFGTVIYQKLFPPKPTSELFSGQNILITGTSSGLGLAAAKKIAALQPENLIITARDQSKAEATKHEIERFLKSSNIACPQIIPMVLDMSTAEGVKQFVNDLKSRITDLNAVMLNAGVIQTRYQLSSDGWEEAIQVNTISNLHLALLLIPILISTYDRNPNIKSHLTFSSSGTVWLFKPEDLKNFINSEEPLHEFSKQENFPSGPVGGNTQYSRSKLMMEYAMRRISSSPMLRNEKGEHKIIINSTCPGMVNTLIGRNFAHVGWYMQVALWITFNVFGRSPGKASNIYLSALKQGENTHGHMWKEDTVHQPGPMITSDEGRKMEEKAWKEIVECLNQTNPETTTVLSTI